MKRTLLLLILVATASCGIGKQAVSELPEQERTVTLEGSQNEIYVKANSWMVENFKNAKSVIQFTDKESGTIIGKYYLSPISPGSEYYGATAAYAIIKVLVKDNASKIIITPDRVTYMEGNLYNQYKEEVAQAQIDALLLSFEDYMSSSQSDW